MRETQSSSSELCLDKEFKSRALSGQGARSLWLCDLGYEEKRVPRLSIKGFPLQYRVVTGAAPTVSKNVAAKDS